MVLPFAHLCGEQNAVGEQYSTLVGTTLSYLVGGSDERGIL